MPTFAQLSNIPRNKLLGTFADLLQAGKDNTGVVGDFLLGQAPETLNDMSYGFNPTRGKGMTYGMKPEAADLANVIPTASLAGILGKSYAKFAGKQIAKQVQNGTGMLGRNMMNPRMNMTAYHGSPHSFDKFDMSKIGTGEGAQAYGHGLYFAESKDVAKGYANELGSKFSVNGKSIYNANNTNGAVDNSDLQDALIASLGNAKQTAKSLLTSASEMRKANVSPKDYQLALAELRKIRGGIKLENTGNLYKVDIPDDAIPKMLDWDKPLSQQSNNVMQSIGVNPQDASKYNKIVSRMDELQNIQGGLDSPEWNSLLDQAKQLRAKNNLHLTGKDYYEKMAMDSVGRNGAGYNHNKEAATALRLQGLTGIRYLDGSSRGVGEGSSNFVVFDDQLPKMLERNGQPMQNQANRYDQIEQWLNNRGNN